MCSRTERPHTIPTHLSFNRQSAVTPLPNNPGQNDPYLELPGSEGARERRRDKQTCTGPPLGGASDPGHRVSACFGSDLRRIKRVPLPTRRLCLDFLPSRTRLETGDSTRRQHRVRNFLFFQEPQTETETVVSHQQAQQWNDARVPSIPTREGQLTT